MATIKKRGPFQWQAQVRRKGYPAKTQTFETRAAARSWARSIERDMEAGEFVDNRKAAETLVKDAFERYLADVSIHNKGHSTERVRLNRLIKDRIASFSLATLTPEALIDYRDRRLEEVSPATVRRELDLISQVISTAIIDWRIPLTSNPISQMRRPAPARPRDRRLRGDEEAVLAASLAAGTRGNNGLFTKGTRNPWLPPLFELAIETAARRSELLRATWENVHLKKRYIWCEDSKNGESRQIPLSRRAVEILRELKSMHEEAASKAKEAGRRFDDNRVFKTTENAVKKAWARAKEREGITDLRWHDLRHEGTTRAAQKLSNIIELSSYTGHKDPRQLKRYYNPTALEIAEKLDS